MGKDPNTQVEFDPKFGMGAGRDIPYETERVSSSFADLVALYVEKRRQDGFRADAEAVYSTIHDKIVTHMLARQKKQSNFTFDDAYNDMYRAIFQEYSSYKVKKY